MKYISHFFHLGMALIMYLPVSAQAIVNVEQAVIGHGTEGMHTSVSLLTSGSGGNTDKSSTRFDLLSLWQHDNNYEFLQLQHTYGTSRGQVDADSSFVHLRHRTDVSDTLGIEAFAQAGQDRFSRMSLRTLLGGGLRWVLFEKEGSSAGYFGLGAFHEEETLSEALGTSDVLKTEMWRANSYLVLKHQINEQVRINSTTYYQPGMADSADYRLLEQASILVKLVERLDLKLVLEYSLDSKPPQTVLEHDIYYSVGIEYSF